MFADMDNFTFDRTSRHTEKTTSCRARSRSISPCSSAANVAALSDSHFTLTDLAIQFSGQRLRKDAQICYDPCDSYANLDDDAGWQIEVDDVTANGEESFRPTPLIAPFPTGALPFTRRRTCPPRPRSPSQRMQRQASARLLCSATHTRDIATLVAEMVKSHDQCSVVRSPVLSASTSTLSIDVASPTSTEIDEDALDEDEGYDSGSASGSSSTSRRTSTTISSSSSISLPALCIAGHSRPRPELYRRASDRRHVSGASVCKPARFRREPRLSHSRQ